MLCDQQMATSFSVRDILEFDDSDGMIGNDPGPVAAATAGPVGSSSLLEPIMMVNPAETDPASTTGYYANYWLENGIGNNVSDNRMMMPMDEQQTAPTYIALQQGHHQHHPAPIDPVAHYDYSYSNYVPYDCPAEEFNRFREEDETKLAQRNQTRPLTTSHHVQQLSHLCPPFSDQEVSCGNSMEITANKVKSNRKYLKSITY